MTGGSSGIVRRGAQEEVREEGGEVHNLPAPAPVVLEGTEEEDGAVNNQGEAHRGQVHTIATMCEYFRVINDDAATLTTEKKMHLQSSWIVSMSLMMQQPDCPRIFFPTPIHLPSGRKY